MTNIQRTEQIRARLEKALGQLASDIGPIQIGTPQQFPFGWRKAGKGRTVWRILEEVITQNLQHECHQLGFQHMACSESEVSVYDFRIRLTGDPREVFVNIKSAVEGARSNKDDISKGVGLQAFYREDPSREIFIATFVISFHEDMTIHLERCHVMPIAWLPDIYINPSNNGNLQSAQYKNVEGAVRRTNEEFFRVLNEQMEIAREKRNQRALVGSPT